MISEYHSRPKSHDPVHEHADPTEVSLGSRTASQADKRTKFKPRFAEFACGYTEVRFSFPFLMVTIQFLDIRFTVIAY